MAVRSFGREGDILRKGTTFWVLLLCVVIMLQGCNRQVPQGNLGSEVWESMPNATIGILESETISVQPWNSGRLEATSRCSMCEGESGYYLIQNGCVYYADKSNLNNWMVLCSKPDCSHQSGVSGCSAQFGSDSFIAKNGRLYFAGLLSQYPHLYKGTGSGAAIMSVLPNGTDLRLEYCIEESLLNNGGSFSHRMKPGYWLYLADALEETGESTVRLYVTDENGTRKILEKTRTDTTMHVVISPAEATLGINGNSLYYCDFLEKPGYYSFTEDALMEFALPDVPLAGGYLAEDTLRFFRQNDGYYDYNLQTGEEIFLTGAQLTNSYTAILLPNLIVESSLLYALSTQGRLPGMEHKMEIFDGEQWHSIDLPEDLRFASMNAYLFIRGVASDSIFFSRNEYITESEDGKLKNYQATHLYRINFSSEDWRMEHLATIKQPLEG